MPADSKQLRDLQTALGRIAAAPPALQIVEALADHWVDTTQQRVRVDTGQQRARTNVTMVSGSGVMGVAELHQDVPYAGFQEYGTRYVAPRPAFRDGRDAAVVEAAKYGARIETQLQRSLDSGGSWSPRNLV